MYIGPWQEYKLSQDKKIESEKKSEDSNHQLRKQLLKALSESLEPEAAAIAIRAIDKTLDVPSNHPKLTLPNIQVHDRRIRSYRRPLQRNIQSNFPLIKNYAYDSDKDSIPSTRSTMSEPIHGTKLAFTPDERPPSHRERRKPSSVLPHYDPNGVLDILRLKKQEELKQKKPDFSEHWKWKETVKGKIHKHDGGKIERVRQLKELYNQHLSVSPPPSSDLSSDDPISPHSRITLSPIRSRPGDSSPLMRKPTTPVIQDKELTDLDYATVSKYFPKGIASHGQMEERRSPSKLSSLAPLSSPCKIDPKFRSPAGVINDEEDGGGGGGGRFHYDSSLNRKKTPTLDMYEPPGSPESLINWCSSLNVDNIDDLY